MAELELMDDGLDARNFSSFLLEVSEVESGGGVSDIETKLFNSFENPSSINHPDQSSCSLYNLTTIW